LNHLEEFRSENGRYLFPRNYLQERPLGYWVSGLWMGLEENRRSNLSLEIESSFRMAGLLAGYQSKKAKHHEKPAFI